MKSKASYFSISKALVLENLRRFWAIPTLAFLVYFLSGVFPILMSYRHLDDMASYINLSLNNQQPFYMSAHLIFPIITAVIIFRYLQSVNSVSVMHSMPFTRNKLYNSGFVSGLILIISPILLNGLILLAISKPSRSIGIAENGISVNDINVFARAGILNWIWVSILIVIVIYAISVFAGIITGNAIMHFALAGFFNFLIPGLYAIFIAYFEHFLYGFDSSGNWIEICMKISPFLNAIESGGHFGIGVTIYYIANFLVLFIITGMLYNKRKLERASDSLTFTFMQPVICYITAFLGMTLLGFYFDVLGESDYYMYAGLAAGTLIFFILSQMIINKSPRVFNMQNLYSFGIYSLIAIVFIVSLNIDITGFERRVPNAGKINSFTITENFDSSYNSYRSHINGNVASLKFKDEKNIEAITSLHKYFIDARENEDKDDKKTYSNLIKIEYDLGGIFPMFRQYSLNYDVFQKSPEFKQLYESKEFKDYYSFNNFDYERLTEIDISSQTPYAESILIKGPAEMSEFMACIEKDFQAQTFSDLVSLKHCYAVADINYTYRNPDSNQPNALTDTSISHKITNNCTNTIKWLESHGYSKKLEQSASQVKYIELYHYVEGFSNYEEEIGYADDSMTTKDVAFEGDRLKITDPAKIQSLLDTYETQNINYSDYYYGNVVYNYDSSTYSQGGSYQGAMPSKYGESEYATMPIYFNEGNIPNYVLEYFK